MEQDNSKKPAFVKRDSIVSGKEYAQLLGLLKERFRRSQIKAAVKVNTEMLEFYWAMGRDISELYKSARYGSAFFDSLRPHPTKNVNAGVADFGHIWPCR